MKSIRILGAFLLLVTSSHGHDSLVDAGRFIHIRSADEHGQEDSYLRAAAIDAVVIHRSEREADKERPFKVQLTTRLLTARQKGNPEAWAMENRIHVIDCGSPEEAEKVAAAIVAACSGDGKPQPEAESATR